MFTTPRFLTNTPPPDSLPPQKKSRAAELWAETHGRTVLPLGPVKKPAPAPTPMPTGAAAA